MRTFTFSVDEECVEFYEGDEVDYWPIGANHRLIFILTASEMIRFQQVLKEAMFEWKKVNKLPLDFELNPERKE
jgi:hypothetical protein